MFELVIKAAALFFLVQALLNFAVGVLSKWVMPSIPLVARARFVTISHLMAMAVALSFTVAMVWLTGGRIITMETMLFLGLMSGSGELAIYFAGWIGLALSLLSSYIFLRSSGFRVREMRAFTEHYHGIPVVESVHIEGAWIIGVFKPIIVVSSRLKSIERDIALKHEYAHARLGHNLMKVLMHAVLRLNMFNLALHRVLAEFDELCEYECDALLAFRLGTENYLSLLGRVGAPSSGKMERRITAIEELGGTGRRNSGRLYVSYVASAASVISPAFLFAGLTLPRCAVVCFLGF